MMDWGIIYRIVKERISLNELVADCLADDTGREKGPEKAQKGCWGNCFPECPSDKPHTGGRKKPVNGRGAGKERDCLAK